MSEGEKKIRQILLRAKAIFSQEHIFSDLKRKGFLRFDFCILDKDNKVMALIEYDSALHFEQIKHFHKKSKEFLQAQERDRQKNKYCLANKITLYRIPYWKLDYVQTYDDLFQEEFLVKSIYHNDYLIRR